MTSQTRVLAKRATKFRQASPNLISNIVKIKTKNCDLSLEADPPLAKISMDSQDYQEVLAYLNPSSSCQVSQVKVTNMIQLCSSNISKLHRVLDSQITLSKGLTLQELKTFLHKPTVQPVG